MVRPGHLYHILLDDLHIFESPACGRGFYKVGSNGDRQFLCIQRGCDDGM